MSPGFSVKRHAAMASLAIPGHRNPLTRSISWGVRLYLDEGSHVGLHGKPFWYGGLLNIFNTVEGQELRPNDNWDNLEQSKTKFREFYSHMSSEPSGGLDQPVFSPLRIYPSMVLGSEFRTRRQSGA